MSYKTMAARIQYDGGKNNIKRINKQMYRSFLAATKDDMNSRVIKTPNLSVFPAIITASNLKSDYDKKYVAVSHDAQLEAGDTFTVLDDNTHWMVYLPVLTQTAYLRSEIIRCRYTIEVNDKKYWIYFQGMTETDIRFYRTKDVVYNKLNYSGTIYIKNDENTRNYFKRFTIININGKNYEVQVTDAITVPGVLELEVQEYYNNSIENMPKVVEECCQNQIIGRTTVKQKQVIGYEIDKKYFHQDYSWSIEGNDRVKIKSVSDDKYLCEVKVEDGAVGNFTLRYGNKVSGYNLKIKIDISQPAIKGKEVVYPYDKLQYSIKDDAGVFYTDSQLAKVENLSKNTCGVEIISGRSGKFNLYFKSANTGEVCTLPITIRSF